MSDFSETGNPRSVSGGLEPAGYAWPPSLEFSKVVAMYVSSDYR